MTKINQIRRELKESGLEQYVNCGKRCGNIGSSYGDYSVKKEANVIYSRKGRGYKVTQRSIYTGNILIEFQSRKALEKAKEILSFPYREELNSLIISE